MSTKLTKEECEYVATKFIKFERGGNNVVNVCEIDGKPFVVVFGRAYGERRFMFPPSAIQIMRGAGVEKFFAVNEKDISDNGWYSVADCVTLAAQRASGEPPVNGVIPFYECILCGGVTTLEPCGFVPNERMQRAYGAPANKTRTISYSLCETCVELPDSERNERVEAKLFGMLPIPLVRTVH